MTETCTRNKAYIIRQPHHVAAVLFEVVHGKTVSGKIVSGKIVSGKTVSDKTVPKKMSLIVLLLDGSNSAGNQYGLTSTMRHEEKFF